MSKDKTYRFAVIVEPCEEGGYYAQCPAFQGCHVEGETYEETMSEMRKAINAFIDEYLKDGEKIPDDEFTITSLKVAV
ncbi:MAG: type II toxin-antitoxin system HicB family antitoxin [Thermodesulfobacteriota bacterium]